MTTNTTPIAPTADIAAVARLVSSLRGRALRDPSFIGIQLVEWQRSLVALVAKYRARSSGLVRLHQCDAALELRWAEARRRNRPRATVAVQPGQQEVRSMKAKDVMTTQVVSVGPDSTVAEVADILLTRCISAVPVIDGQELVGIVSEGDLIRRAEIGTAERHRSWWLRLFDDSATLAAEYVKTHAERIRDVMTRNVVTVTEDTSIAEVAAVLEKNRIKRVPVVRDGRLVGIVSRANLIRRLAAAKARPLTPAAPDDGAIRMKVLDALQSQPWSDIGTAAVR